MLHSIASDQYAELEEQTYEILKQAIDDLTQDKEEKLQEIAENRAKLSQLLEQIGDLNKMLNLKQSQIEQEFGMAVKQLKVKASEHLRLQRRLIKDEIRQIE